jgi:hypothetical protein
VVKTNIFKLHVQGMAFLTILTQLTFVDVFMTGDAARVDQEIALGFPPRRGVDLVVTLPAIFHFGMQSLEAVTGLQVVESARLPTHHLEIHSLVIVVTLEAVVFFPGMKSPVGYNSGEKLLVTGEAFFRRESAPRVVARRTVFQTGQVGMGTG